MIDEESRNALVAYRIVQAKQTSEEAHMLLSNDMLRGAMNRIYYGMFYMLQALSLKYQFESSKHAQLIGWFNKNFVHTNKIEIKFSKIISKAYNLRTKGDYATVYTLDKQELTLMYKEMLEFIARLEKLLSD